MEVNLELSKNLLLNYIEENNYQNGKLIAVTCYFSFFNEPGVAYVVVDKLSKDHPSYGMIEIDSELSDSFENQLEDEDNWENISSAINEYIVIWNQQNEE